MKKPLLSFCLALIALQLSAQNFKLLIGTYTVKGTSEGIYVYEFDSKTAETKLLSTAKAENPSYLTLSADKKFVYSVNEAGKNSGVSSFRWDKRSGRMLLADKRSTVGGDPCYITTNGNQIIVANYSGGSIEAFYTSPTGKFLASKQLIQHTGKSIDPQRQLSAHVHQVQKTPDKKYLVATDLGEDKIYFYAFAPSHRRELTLKETVPTTPGSGPRHLTFSPNGRYAYLAHEFNGKISVFAYHDGSLKKLQEIETTPNNFSGKIDGADIHMSADGKFLYETNRGDANTISIFSVAENGTLTLVDITSTLGKGPRNFIIDPTGNYLLVAHQYTNNVVIFHRDQSTGKLKDSGKRIEVGIPVCLIFDK